MKMMEFYDDKIGTCLTKDNPGSKVNPLGAIL